MEFSYLFHRCTCSAYLYHSVLQEVTDCMLLTTETAVIIRAKYRMDG